MKLSEYQDLYGRLSTAEDIDFLAENFGHDKELLLVIYTQRIVREAKLHTWLDARSLQYETEKDLRAKYDKTPDILLHKPIEMNGSRKYWIESKATFGDPYEIRRHLRKQLQPYSDMFGDGAVVYWF